MMPAPATAPKLAVALNPKSESRMDCEAVDAGFAALLQDPTSARPALDCAWPAAAGDIATRWLLFGRGAAGPWR